MRSLWKPRGQPLTQHSYVCEGCLIGGVEGAIAMAKSLSGVPLSPLEVSGERDISRTFVNIIKLVTQQLKIISALFQFAFFLTRTSFGDHPNGHIYIGRYSCRYDICFTVEKLANDTAVPVRVRRLHSRGQKCRTWSFTIFFNQWK